jgi:hypothetical protein
MDNTAPNSTTDISSPAYFEKTFKVDAAQAHDLSRQAKFVSANGGGGITAEAPGSIAPATPSAPAPGAAAAPLSARAEFDQLWADRAAGKISNFAWNDKAAQAHRDALVERIANGEGAQAAPLVPVAAEMQHPYLGAPSNPADYGLLHNAGELPEEKVAELRGQEAAFGRLNLNPKVVQDVNARLRTYVAKYEHATPAEAQSVVDSNYTRFISQCQREGIDRGQAEALIGAQLKAWSTAEPSLRPTLKAIVETNDPTMLDYILQIAKFNRGAKRI